MTANTPPAFIMVSADDNLCGELCLNYFKVLNKAGVWATLHVYPEGGHGWGFKDAFKYKRLWTSELEMWLREMNHRLSKQKADIIQQKTIEDGGTGPYKAIAAKVNTLNDYVIYRPANLNDAVKNEKQALPLVIFANGGCHDCSVRYESMLSEIASHGYVVIAFGELRMEHDLEGIRKTNSYMFRFVTDWVQKQTKDAECEYFGKIDVDRIATVGQSCGGAQVLASCNDLQFKTHILYNSGIGNMNMAGADSACLKNLHAPILYMPGGKSDVATANAEIDYERIKIVPTVLANHTTAGHLGAFNEPKGGSYAKLSLMWLDWQLKGKKQNKNLFIKGDKKNFPWFDIKSKNL